LAGKGRAAPASPSCNELGVASESIQGLTARSSKAATQRRNAVARYRFKLSDRHDAMAIASVPIPFSRGEEETKIYGSIWTRSFGHSPNRSCIIRYML